MNQYFEFKDLAQYEFVESHPNKNGETITYKVPKSEGFSEKSVEKILKKYDIEFRPSGKPKMLRIRLKVHGVNRGTETEPDWEYDINTFEYPYSDAVLASCIDVFLNFEDNRPANCKKAEYAMSGLDEKPIMTMLEDFAKRHGKIRLYEEPSLHTWLICYEHCQGGANKDKTEKTILTFCVSCTDKERYIRDIYITKSYEELTDKIQDKIINVMPDEWRSAWIGRWKADKYPMFCVNASQELLEAIQEKRLDEEGKCNPHVHLFYDVSLIPLYLDSIIETLHRKNKFRLILERYREELMDAYKKCCSAKFGTIEYNQSKEKFAKILVELGKESDCIIMDDYKDSVRVAGEIQFMFLNVERLQYFTKCFADTILPGLRNKRTQCGIDFYNFMARMGALNRPEFIGMEPYRIRYLLDVLLHHKKNITPERLRLKLLCDSDISYTYSITMENDFGTRTIILEPGKRLDKRNRTKEYRPLFSMVHTCSEKDRLHIIMPVRFRYIEGKHNVLLKSVHCGNNVKSAKVPYGLWVMLRETKRIYKYNIRLKPVPAPRISGPYVTLSDVCKRLEKLVYDI